MLTLLLLASCAKKLDYFHTALFQPLRDGGLYPVEIGLEEQGLTLSGYGYFNNDKYCDAMVVNKDKNEVYVYLWDQNNLRFDYNKILQAKIDGVIEQSLPGDFNDDGQLDIALTIRKESKCFIKILIQTKQGFSIQTHNLSIDCDQQPAIVDINGDMKLDLIYNSNNSAVVQVAQNGWFKQELLSKFISDRKDCMQQETVQLSTPHSVSFIDLNKDCLADLFITEVKDGKLTFSFWLSEKNGKYCIAEQQIAPKGAQQVSFADIDKNGLADLILPVIDARKEIRVIYNDHKNSESCTFDSKLINRSNFKYNLNDYQIVLELEQTPSGIGDKLDPFTVKFIDLDIDGYPDFAISFDQGNSSVLQSYMNVEDEKLRRKFTKDKDIPLQDKTARVISISYFDIDENGIEDFIINQSIDNTPQILSIYNNVITDNFHLKTLCLNGKAKQQYSVLTPGAVILFTLTELDQKRTEIHSTQVASTAYNRLMTPYNIFGLGRTNSYIDTFYAALPIYENNNKMWTPIIPNSYLIVSPEPGQLQWFLELFTSPSDKIEFIISVAVAFLVILGGFIVWRYRKERAADKEDIPL